VANAYKRHGSSRTTKRRLFTAPAKKAPPRRRVALTTTARPATALASSLTAGQRRYRGTVLGLEQRASAMDARFTGVLF
jgi:hypothetical protein